MPSYFHCFGVNVWTGENDSNYAPCGRIFLFENREKILRFQKYTDTCGQGLKWQKKTLNLKRSFGFKFSPKGIFCLIWFSRGLKQLYFLSQLEKLIEKNYYLHKSAREAYRSYLQAYASHQHKNIFNVNALDLQRVAPAFGFTVPPRVNLSIL